jgi:hypothetical protein
MTVTGQAAPGWYPDPSDPRRLRWFDGAQWTSQVSGAGIPTQTAPTQAPRPSSGCSVCGASPAAEAVFFEQYGLLLASTRKEKRGRWCRDCGTAQFRKMQRRSLLTGWWGLRSWAFNLITVGRNIKNYRKVEGLATPSGRVRPARPPQPSVVRSPGFAITLLLPLLPVLYWIHLGQG